MTRALVVSLAALCLASCAIGLSSPPPAAVSELAPAGALRAVINQAMGMRLGREAGAKYLRAFVEDMKASGFVAQALQRHSIEGAAVAPAGGAP